MPRTGWLALGVFCGALAIGALELAPLGAAGLLGGTAMGLAGLVLVGLGTTGRMVGLVVLGLGLACLRSVVGGTAEPSDLEATGGPWAGVVEALGPARDGRQRAIVRLGVDGARVLVDLPPEPRLAAGDVVTIEGRLRSPPDGPYGDYLRRSGLRGSITAEGHARIGHGTGPAVALADLRTASAEALARAIPEPEAGLAAGILVGLRERLDRTVAGDFTTAGLSHIVAISGWNIAIVGAAVAAAVGRVSRRRRIGLTVAAVVAYVVFVGPSASVVRAATMALIVLLARLSGRGGRAPAALATAVVVLLVSDPALATDPGFQLSVVATAGLLRWATPFSDALAARTGERLPGWLVETLGASLAAQLATLPIVVAVFGRISLVAPLANLVVVPLVPFAMALAGIALIGGALGGLGIPVVAEAAGMPAWLVLRVIVETARLAAELPFASLAVGEPFDGGIGVAAGVAVLALAARRDARSERPPVRQAVSMARAGRLGGNRGRRRPIAVLLLVPVAAGLLAAAYRPAGDPQLVVFDVGQGDAILVDGGQGGRLLVDGGPDPGLLLRLLDGRLPPWDRRIDVVVASHPHEDHLAGLPSLLARYRVGKILTNGMRGPGPAAGTLAELLASDERTGVLARGDHLEVDGVELDVLWPLPGTVPATAPDSGSEINDTSIVLLGSADGRRFLLTGDVEEGVDPALVARGLPPIDVLKVAHHGSRTATTAAFLAATRPSVAVVSVGADNRYGHPAPETLARLRAIGARVLRTDAAGTVEVVFRPRSIDVHSARGVERLDGAGGRAWLAEETREPSPAAGDAATVAIGSTEPGGRGSRPRAGEGRGLEVGYDRWDAPDARPRAGRPDDRTPPSPAGPLGAATSRSVGLGTAAPRQGERASRDRVRGRARLGPQPPARVRAGGRRGGWRNRLGRGRRDRAPPFPGDDMTQPNADETVAGRRRSDPASGGGRSSAPRAPLGFFTGDDEYAIEEAATAFGRRIAGSGPPLERWRVSGGEVDLGAVVTRLGTAALFGSGTLVVLDEPAKLIHDPDKKQPKPSPRRRAELVDRLLDSVAEGNALAILDLRGPGTKPSAALAALRAGVEARGGIVRDFKAPTGGKMTAWILERARERGIHLEPAAADELAARVGAFVTEGDVDRRATARLASSELDKLGNYRGSEPVRVEDVRALVAEAVPASTWAALDAVGERRVRSTPARPGALALLDRLVETTPPPLLVAQLHRRLRELVEIRSALDAGATIPTVARQLKLHGYRAQRLAEQAAHWSIAELEAALEGLLALDLRFKNVPPATEQQQRLALALWLLDRVAPPRGLTGGGRRTAEGQRPGAGRRAG